MDQSSVYDTDILEWSEQQASALRDLARTRRDLPNELDLEHVAEEIEDVGRSEFVAVQSLVRQILIHVIKAVSVPEAPALLHWRKEVVAFHGDMLDRITPSMRARLDAAKLWQQAIRRAEADLAAQGQGLSPELPKEGPLRIADIVSAEFDFLQAVTALRAQMVSPE